MELTSGQLAVLDAIARGTAAYGQISARALTIEGVDEQSCGGLISYINWVDSRVYELHRLKLVDQLYLGHQGQEVDPEEAGFYSIMQRINPRFQHRVSELLSEWRGRTRPSGQNRIRPSSLAARATPSPD
jgi:hypothetical protein